MSEDRIKYKNKILFLTLIAMISLVYLWKDVNKDIKAIPALTNKEEINTIIKEYILNNPTVIVESLEDMQKRKIKDMKDKMQSLITGKKAELENSSNTPFFGNDKGDIIIVEFFDYKCGYCKKANSILTELVANDPMVKVILKPLPILGEASEYSAKIALAVYNTRPDKFKAFHDDMMSLDTITKEALIDLAEKHELGYSTLEDEMDKAEVKDEIQKVRDLAMEIEINGAPAFIINGEHYSGLLDLLKLQDIIRNIRSKTSS